ncbi:MAG: PIN domain-containing protein [Chitinophagaceae bacterium]
MASKVFLDANILLDLTLRRVNYGAAKEIMLLAIGGRIQAFVTSSIIHILGYWLTKAYDHKKAKEIILSLLHDITCIDIQQEQVISSLHSTIRDMEDALQYYAAIHHRLDYIYKQGQPIAKGLHPYFTGL